MYIQLDSFFSYYLYLIEKEKKEKLSIDFRKDPCEERPGTKTITMTCLNCR